MALGFADCILRFANGDAKNLFRKLDGIAWAFGHESSMPHERVGLPSARCGSKFKLRHYPPSFVRRLRGYINLTILTRSHRGQTTIIGRNAHRNFCINVSGGAVIDPIRDSWHIQFTPSGATLLTSEHRNTRRTFGRRAGRGIQSPPSMESRTGLLSP